MNSLVHKITSTIVFGLLYYYNLFPAIVNDYLHNNIINLLIGLLIAFFFSGGRISNKSLLSFGLSADNDYHKKMKRDWLMHSGVIPTIVVLLIPHPVTYLAGFFYASHVALDLLNTRSWDGTQYTYIAVFLTTVLFYGLVYS